MEVVVTAGGTYAGKTNNLIDLAEMLKDAEGIELIVIKPEKENVHSDKPEIESHTGRKFPAMLMSRLEDILTFIKTALLATDKKVTVILDEYQFFYGDGAAFFRALVKDDVTIFIYGLDLDSAGETWPLMNAAMGYANNIVKKHGDTPDHKYSQKLNPNGQKVSVSKDFKLVNGQEWDPTL